MARQHAHHISRGSLQGGTRKTFFDGGLTACRIEWQWLCKNEVHPPAGPLELTAKVDSFLLCLAPRVADRRRRRAAVDARACGTAGATASEAIGRRTSRRARRLASRICTTSRGLDLPHAYMHVRMCYEVLRNMYMDEPLVAVFNGAESTQPPSSADIMARVQSFPAHSWYHAAKDGDTRERDRDDCVYDPRIHHTFTNTFVGDDMPALPPGETHIAIGFVDLSYLTSVALTSADSSNPAHWVGIEGSIYCVAKTRVILAMLLGKASVDAILQVRYSSCWLQSTLTAFQAGVAPVLLDSDHLTSSVRDLLTHWQACVPSVETARNEWKRKLDNQSLCASATFASPNDRMSALEYALTGQLLGADVGSVTMSGVPSSHPSSRACMESIFHAVDVDAFLSLHVTSRAPGRTLMDACADYLRSRIARLQHHLVSGFVVVEIWPPTTLRARDTLELQLIKAYEPHSISWGNVGDYMSQASFHAMAKACSHSNRSKAPTLHSCYFMNWPRLTKGAMLLDNRMDDAMQRLLDATRDEIAALYMSRPGYACLGSPRQDLLTTILVHGLAKTYASKCVEQFPKYGAHVLKHGMRPYNCLAYANVSLFFDWQFAL
ncbi:hypothetical protein SDRG_00235 [Saprolegnia diclina VS20]|uniref:Uncharacterized protein n=1 Tax=Saprolegnia diclina (strain VS20) TaxID=1156394 RepID=T0SI59_SAPDV|nr:hypothetical protein SDRG_00235 [Saprolegnia diclina VS20]EQC42502.1 hypothetical protein SDRG_00235 [Saprolegnia diclina VS20]|eukprot:XP_008603925.1 hypothetical protein SDRG_00235 [Saprolegnia diclina VS20]